MEFERDFKTPLELNESHEQLHFKIPSKKLIANTTVVQPSTDIDVDIKNLSLPMPIPILPENDESPKEKSIVDLPYKVPAWSGVCAQHEEFCLEVLKNGCIIDKIDIRRKPFYVFGRQKECDIQLEHPSISRYHAILQYRQLGDRKRDEVGWYLYDMGSTHGTVMNKQKVPPHMHIRAKVGYVMKFGGSSRLFVLQGPDEDVEPESELTVTEIKQKAEKQKLIALQAKSAKQNILEQKLKKAEEEKNAMENNQKNETDAKEESCGVDWGMGFDTYGKNDDEDEDENEGENIDLEDVVKREQFYIDDPKKALKNFFDREGCELKYEYFEKGKTFNRQWHCRVELPVETSTGRTIYAEVTVTGGKKEASTSCALEACRMLDAYGVLRKSHQESKKPQGKSLRDNDYYDSDEDVYFDRTGELERKRHERQKRLSTIESATGSRAATVDNYETLQVKLVNVENEIERVKQQLELLNAELHEKSGDTNEQKKNTDRDTLDDYMINMSRIDSSRAKTRSSQLRQKLIDLNKSATRFRKLVAIARPASSVLSTLKGASSKIITGSMKRPTPSIIKDSAPTDDQITFKNQVKTVFIGQEEVEVEEKEVETAKEKSANHVELLTQKEEDVEKTVEMRRPGIKANISVEKTDNNTHTEAKKAKIVLETKEKPSFMEYDKMNDPDYAVWMPPENQSGDGRTSLNEKLGY
uniref:FHA domain-containing protein n=1 Tax=Romanomermis culicivorax TaxID=13658 RepID=A0A915KW83_ROMCU